MKTWRFLTVGILLSVMIAIGAMGCDGDGKKDGDDGVDGGVDSGLVDDGGVKTPADDPVWIRVNGKEVHKSEIDRESDNLAREMGGAVPPELADTLKRFAMQRAAQRALLEDAVEKAGIKIEEQVLEDEVAKIKSNYPDPTFFEEWLTSQGLTEATLKEEVALNMRFLRFFEDNVKIEEPTDEEIAEEYEQLKPRLIQPPKVNVIHVFLRVAPEASPEDKQKKRELAESIRQRAVAGENMSDLAAEFSDSPSRGTEGKESFVAGKLGEDFDSKVFSLKKDELSEVIETPAGLHVLQIIENVPERPTPLWEVKDQIKEAIKNGKQRELYPAFMEEMMASAKLEYLEPLPEDKTAPPLTPDDGSTASATPDPTPEPGSTTKTAPGDTAPTAPGSDLKGSETK